MPATGRSLPHDSAHGHVTGKANYIEDLPPLAGELWIDYVGAPTAAGRVTWIDVSKALAAPGVVAAYTVADLPGDNHFGPIFSDEPFLADEEIAYLEQPIVIIAAESRLSARKAKALVQIEYEETPPILTIDAAIAAKSFIGPTRRIDRGDFDAAFSKAPHTLEGVLESGGQEQFYFESQACQAIPGEGREIRILSSTQNPTETQTIVAEALGLSLNDVVCECRRMGGGFGGKETQSALPAMMVALAAKLTGRPARIVLTKHDDMRLTGKRHPYKTPYRVAFDDRGRLLAVEMDFFSNAGAFADLSTSIMERSLLHADNAYYLPVVRLSGTICRTNLPPNTAFRGFGGPQAVLVIENILQEIAQRLGLDAIDVRRENVYHDGDAERSHTPYGQLVKDHVLPELFDQLEKASDYRQRIEAVSAFNQKSRDTVKGLAMTAIKFGISFTTKFLNQGNALVNVYTDGTVQVSTGGTEMGQGLNTKIRQVVADEFGIDPAHVRLMTTSTEKNHNTSPTAASAGTDLNGAAALEACRQIKNRMTVYAAGRFASLEEDLDYAPEQVWFTEGYVCDTRLSDSKHRIPFGEFCTAARMERVDLGARGFYATPGVDFDKETGKGSPFFYFTTGVAATEVTIDRLTGELTIDRCDLLMDIGEMINPGIDRGQVIGAFVQGLGWSTTEELRYADDGQILTTGPTTYKIPNITDLPPVLNVDFIKNPKHQKNVRHSKAVGEPPLMLGISAWVAVKHAMSFIAPDQLAPLSLPATSEECLMCIENLKRKN